MDATEAQLFDSVETARGWTYRLHPQDRFGLGSPRLSGLPILYSIVFFLVPGIWFLSVSIWFRWNSLDFMPLATPLIGLAWIASGVLICISTLQRRVGSDELALDSSAIRIVRRLGPLRWSKKVRWKEVEQFLIIRNASFSTGKKGQWERQVFHALAVENPTGSVRKLISYYPRETLLALASRLSTQGKSLGFDPDWSGDWPVKRSIREKTEDPLDMSERRDQPRGSRLLLEQDAEDGVRISAPPHSVLSGNFSTPILFAGFFLLFAIVLSIPMYESLANGKAFVSDTGQPQSMLCCGSIVTGLLLLGLGSFLAAIKNVTVGHVLISTPESLTMETTGLRGTRRKTWARSDIASIDARTEAVSDSEGGLSFPTKFVISMRSGHTESPQGLFDGLSKPEMEWIATTLRNVLGVPSFDVAPLS